MHLFHHVTKAHHHASWTRINAQLSDLGPVGENSGKIRRLVFETWCPSVFLEPLEKGCFKTRIKEEFLVIQLVSLPWVCGCCSHYSNHRKSKPKKTPKRLPETKREEVR